MLKRNPLINRIKALFPRVPPSAPDSESKAPADIRSMGASIKKPAQRLRMGFSYRREIVTSLGEAPTPLPDNAYTSPLTVAGTVVGEIQTAADETAWTGREIEIVDAAAALLAQHLENLSRPERNEPQAHG
jgi:hypothetical protein